MTRIEAAARLLAVADRELTLAGSAIDDFVNVLASVSEPTVRRERGLIALGVSLENAYRAAGAVTAAKTAAAGEASIASATGALDNALQGADELASAIRKLQAGGDAAGTVSPSRIAAMVSDARGRASFAGEQVRRGMVVGDVPAEEAVFKQIATETKAGPLAEGVTGKHVDDVTAVAAKMAASAARMPTLAKLGVNMRAQAAAGKYTDLIGREAEVEQLLNTLGRRWKSNPMLVGDAGVGKTQIVEGLAVRLERGQVPEASRDLELYRLDLPTIQAAAGPQPGAVQKLMGTLLEEVRQERERGGKVAVFVDEIHTFLGDKELANQLKPALARGEFGLIGSTTWAEFNQFIAKDGAIVRRIALLPVEELSKSQVLEVLRSVQPGLSKHHNILVLDSALAEIQRLSLRYARDRKQPDPAIELLDHVMSRVATGWHGAAPARYLELSNDVGRLRANIGMLERQVIMGDTRAAANMVSSRAKLDELAPKLEQYTTQLEAERKVLGKRNELLQQFIKLADEGDMKAAKELETKIAAAHQKVAKLREQYPDPLLRDIVDDDAVREAASNLYNRTISAGGAEDAARALRVRPELEANLIGQPEAIDKIANVMEEIQSGMRDPDGPAGVFLFTGATGVGKTEAVRVTTKVMTDDVRNMIKIDMGEFSEPHSVSKLFGAPPSYVGYGDEPRLAEITKNPEAHLLLDEVEKAHPEIFQKLLAFIEEGTATLGDGRKIDARGVTIYMTTNLKPHELQKFFSAEFLNRIDGIVKFRHLDVADSTKIVEKLQLPKIVERAAENGIKLETTAAARARLVELGFDSQFGARPLKRSLRSHVNQPISKLLLQLKAAGKQVDPATPHTATLDVAKDGGFVLKSADDGIEVLVPATKASDHIPSETIAAQAGATGPDWSLADEAAGAAAQPPKPEVLKQG